MRSTKTGLMWILALAMATSMAWAQSVAPRVDDLPGSVDGGDPAALPNDASVPIDDADLPADDTLSDPQPLDELPDAEPRRQGGGLGGGLGSRPAQGEEPRPSAGRGGGLGRGGVSGGAARPAQSQEPRPSGGMGAGFSSMSGQQNSGGGMGGGGRRRGGMGRGGMAGAMGQGFGTVAGQQADDGLPGTLEEMLRAALANNPEVMQAAAEVKSADAKLRAARLRIARDIAQAVAERAILLEERKRRQLLADREFQEMVKLVPPNEAQALKQDRERKLREARDADARLQQLETELRYLIGAMDPPDVVPAIPRGMGQSRGSNPGPTQYAPVYAPPNQRASGPPATPNQYRQVPVIVHEPGSPPRRETVTELVPVPATPQEPPSSPRPAASPQPSRPPVLPTEAEPARTFAPSQPAPIDETPPESEFTPDDTLLDDSAASESSVPNLNGSEGDTSESAAVSDDDRREREAHAFLRRELEKQRRLAAQQASDSRMPTFQGNETPTEDAKSSAMPRVAANDAAQMPTHQDRPEVTTYSDPATAFPQAAQAYVTREDRVYTQVPFGIAGPPATDDYSPAVVHTRDSTGAVWAIRSPQGIPAEVQRGLDAKVSSIHFVNVSLQNVLDTLAEKAESRLGFVVSRRPLQPFFEGTPTIGGFGGGGNVERKQETVTLSIERELTVRQVMSALVDLYEIAFVVRDYGILVTSPDDAKRMNGYKISAESNATPMPQYPATTTLSPYDAGVQWNVERSDNADDSETSGSADPFDANDVFRSSDDANDAAEEEDTEADGKSGENRDGESSFRTF